MLSPIDSGGVLQLTRMGPRVSGSERDWDLLRERFSQVPCLRLRALFASELLQGMLKHLEEARFSDLLLEGVGTEDSMEENRLWHQLNFMMNDSRLYEFVERVTACGPIGCFQGRVYRFAPGKKHHNAWHDDDCDFRLIGVSINLSPEPFSGSVFQMREEASGKMLVEVANTGPGDAIFFRIGEDLEHRITDLSGTRSKTAFAGWFRAQPDYRSLLGGLGRD